MDLIFKFAGLINPPTPSKQMLSSVCRLSFLLETTASAVLRKTEIHVPSDFSKIEFSDPVVGALTPRVMTPDIR